jgi:hypothetical protein
MPMSIAVLAGCGGEEIRLAKVPALTIAAEPPKPVMHGGKGAPLARDMSSGNPVELTH